MFDYNLEFDVGFLKTKGRISKESLIFNIYFIIPQKLTKNLLFNISIQAKPIQIYIKCCRIKGIKGNGVPKEVLLKDKFVHKEFGTKYS